MFEGIGVGLTVRRPEVDARLAAHGHRRGRLSEMLAVETWSDAEKALELGRIQQVRAMLDAYEAAVVVAFAADRPEGVDPGPGRAAWSSGADARSPVPGDE